MKKITLLCFCVTWLAYLGYAQGIKFVKVKTLQEALALAKAENKIVFLDAYASWCGPCKYLRENVFTEGPVGAYYNQKFISVSFDMENDPEGVRLSKEFQVEAYPTLLFFNSRGMLVHKHVGAMTVPEFIRLGNDAVDPDRQFFVVMQKVRSGSLPPAHFAKFVTDAQNIMADSVDVLIKNYLTKSANSILNKDLLDVILDNETYLDEKQLRELYANKGKLASISGRKPQDIDEICLIKVMRFAVAKSYEGDSLNFDTLRSIVSAYEPAKADKETKIIRTRYLLGKGELSFEDIEGSDDEDVLNAAGVYYYENNNKDKQILHEAKQLFNKLLTIGSPNRMAGYLEYLMAINQKLNAAEEYNYYGRVERLKENIGYRERAFGMDSAAKNDSSAITDFKMYTSHDYGSLSYYQLFLKDFEGCIRSAEKGIEIYPLNDWIYTNLALGYLMTHQFAKADSIYSAFKGKLYSDGSKAFKDAFLEDLDRLEGEGIISMSDPEIYQKAVSVRASLKK